MMRLSTFAFAFFVAACHHAVQGQSLVDLVVETEALSTLEAAVGQAGLVETLNGTGPFTVFAPTDTAFAAVDQDLLNKLLTDPWKAHLTNILLYHVAAGQALEEKDLEDEQMLAMANQENVTIAKSPTTFMVNSANVAQENVEASNGMAHVIDAVLLPSFLEKSIVDIALESATTLASLVEAAGLVDALHNSTDGLTVFAPTNEAFAALDNETVAFLQSDEGKDELIRILQYHVVADVLPAAAIPQGETMLESLMGANLTIVLNGTVTVDDATVVVPDVLASNGIVHVIDKVLLPPPVATEAPSSATMTTMQWLLGGAMASTMVLLLV